jgi:hypothetical protein
MNGEFGPVILVVLGVPIGIVMAAGYYHWARERDLERQSTHQCTRCGIALSASGPAIMCQKCERRTWFTSWFGYHLALAGAVTLIGAALFLSASAGGYEAWGGIVVGSVGGARVLMLAGRIRRRISSGTDG